MDTIHRDVASKLLDLFRGRADYVALGNADGSFRPQKLPGPMQPGWMAKHFEQTECCGFYLMDPESRVCCSCVDFDNKPATPDPEWKSKAEAVYLWLQRSGLCPLLEISASGCAAHVWLFFEENTEAWIVRSFWAVVSEKSGVPFREIYPRQDRLSGKGIGNLVRYPLWNQSVFADPENDWAAMPSLEALSAITKTTGAELKTLAAQLGAGELKPRDPVPSANGSANGYASHPPGEEGELSPRVKARLARKGSLLARRWAGDTSGLKDESKSALALSIATELVRQYVPTTEIEAALYLWCLENGAEKKGQRPDWIGRTVAKAYDFVFTRIEQASANTILMKDACHRYLDTLEKGEAVALASGIAALDESIDGVAPGEMCVIAARPSHGKSALALQWLDHATSKGLPCLLISEEMSHLELGKRSLLSLATMEQKNWSKDEVYLLRTDVNRHYADRAPLYVVESCNTIERVEDVIEQFVGVHGVRLVCVDYLQLLGGRGQKRYDEITDISRRIKQAARRNNVALLAVCQLNREIDKRPDHEPKLSDLKESGQIEQDADLVIFLQWPCRFNVNLHPAEYRIFISKRRNGPIRAGKIITTFNPERQRIGGTPVF